MKSIAMVGAVMLAGLFAQSASANECVHTVEATASMAFNVKEIAVKKSCKEVTINLKNTGTMAKAIMGHNIVITKTADMTAVANDGMAAGADKNYVKPNDARVIAASTVIGGGETTTFKFKTDKLSAKEAYSFFCSFPGHSAIMKGTFKVVG